MSTNIIELKNVKQYFEVNKYFTIKAVDDVSFQIQKGEIFSIVGETGSGKSTLARTILGIYSPTHGEVYFKGNCISNRKGYQQYKNDIQKNIQVIFQDSSAALNPRMTVAKIIAEPLQIHHIYSSKKELDQRIDELLLLVGLDCSYKTKYPSEISGGQRQRVAIARSISVQPDLIIADEPIASLDVSIQAQIINLFKHLQTDHGFSFLFIAHDLSVVRYISDRVGVMYKGRMVEVAPTERLFKHPQHVYTKSLLSEVPIPDPTYERKRQIIEFDGNAVTFSGVMEEVDTEHFVMK